MLYLIELDSIFSLILIIVYALFSLKSVNKQLIIVKSGNLDFKVENRITNMSNNYVNLLLNDVYFFASLFPILFVFGYFVESGIDLSIVSYDIFLNWIEKNPIDILLALLLMVILPSFTSFESILLLLLAFIGSYFMLHSVDLLTFYIALEAQNFCFIVLSGLGTSNLFLTVKNKGNILPIQNNNNLTSTYTTRTDSNSFSVEVTLKYFVLSAFSSGVILFWFSQIYINTGLSVLDFKTTLINKDTDMYNLYTFQILCAMMFKLGAAPLHLWVVQIYSSIKRSLLMFISTVPKLTLFGFWVNSFHSIWTDYSLVLFLLFSIILGSLGAYQQPTLRALFAYSTVNEIGIMLMAVETAGFHSLFQHLSIYIVSQLLLWNLYDKRFFTFLAVSLAGLPPLAGFFGKAWIFWHVSSLNLYPVLIISLFCTGISLVYYLRVVRLFWNNSQGFNTRVIMYNSLIHNYKVRYYSHNIFINYENRVLLTSLCSILLIFIPLFVIKPFVL